MTPGERSARNKSDYTEEGKKKMKGQKKNEEEIMKEKRVKKRLEINEKNERERSGRK